MFGLSGAGQLFCLNTETNKTTWSAPFSKAAAPAQEPPKTGVSETSRPRTGDVRSIRAAGRTRGKGPSRRTATRRIGSRARLRPTARRRPRPRSRRIRSGRGFGRGRGGGDRGYGSIVDVGSALIALTPGGELVAYKPASEAFTELARYKVAERGHVRLPDPLVHTASTSKTKMR